MIFAPICPVSRALLALDPVQTAFCGTRNCCSSPLLRPATTSASTNIPALRSLMEISFFIVDFEISEKALTIKFKLPPPSVSRFYSKKAVKTRLWKPVSRARSSDSEVDRRGHRPPMKLENRNVLIYDFDRPRVDRSQESFDDESDAQNRAATLNLRNHPTQEA